ncbi:MAG: glycosyltransferase family 2 protein [Acidobacteriota bacterium]
MELSVLIVNYNAELHLKNCLHSLYQNTSFRPLEVVVVDNASTDGSVEMLRRDFPQVEVIASPENVGFSAANNQAMRRARGDYFLLLNNDALVRPGAVDTMLRIMKARPEVGVVGPLLRNEDGSVQISYGRMISFRAELVQKFVSGRYEAGSPFFRRYIERRSHKAAYPDWVSGACFMLQAHVAEEAGYFDDNFFMYTEEVDFCQRVRALGYHVLYTPEAEVVHLRGKSTDTNRQKAVLEYRRSQLYFYLKHYGRRKLRLLKLYLLVKTACGWALKGASQRGLHRKLLQLVWSF